MGGQVDRHGDRGQDDEGRSAIHYEAIYRWHPLFADAGFDVWSDGP